MPGKAISFINICKLLFKKPNIKIKLEKRRKPFIKNYGEIPNYINNADGDPWDILVPGYPILKTNKSFEFKELLGVYMLPDGNHKLIIDIDASLNQNKGNVKKDVLNFKRKYEKHTGMKGSIIYF